MRLPDVANRSVICQSFGTNTKNALCQQILRKRLVNSCFPELGRDFNGLLSCIPLQDVSGIDFISHWTIVCCLNHISVGQRRNCWLIIQHGSPKSHETTKSSLWLTFSVNSVNGPQQITQKSSFYKMKGRLLAQHLASHYWQSVVLETAGCAGNKLNGGWLKMCHWCGICGPHSVDGHIVYAAHIMAVRDEELHLTLAWHVVYVQNECNSNMNESWE